jgi:flagellar biosynthesis/type III secretory pathway protein FliH
MRRCFQKRTNYYAAVSDGFVALAAYLRPVAPAPAIELPPVATPPSEICAAGAEYDETLRAVRRFRAALADALEGAVQRLLRAIACEVLARELRLAGADVAAIVTAAAARAGGEKVLSVRAHPDDCVALAGIEIERIADDTLQPGDICLEIASGTIDLKLWTRLDAALAAWAA